MQLALSRPILWAATLVAAVVAAAGLAALAPFGLRPAEAHIDPPGCTSNAAVATLGRTPSGPVTTGTVITYTVEIQNTAAGACNAESVTSIIRYPSGAAQLVLNNVNIAAGESFICPGADPRCQAGPYQYTAQAGDVIVDQYALVLNPATEVCDLLFLPLPPLGPRVAATVSLSGISHSSVTEDQLNACKDISNQFVSFEAHITITPPTDTNAVGTNHTLAITVFADSPAGAVIAAGGGTATASIVSGPGSFVGPNSCSYAGGAASASCTVVISSNAVGTTVVSASSAIPLSFSGLSATLTRSTNGVGLNSGPASKAWVDAKIEIAPPTDTNPVGSNHTLTITVTAAGGTLANGTATATIVSGPGSFVGPNTCNYSGPGPTASCTVVISSNAVGTTVVSASSNIVVGGETLPRSTNGSTTPSGLVNSGPASKAWVDAKIEIAPATDTNPVNTEHTLTITVTAAGGTLANGTATASITSGPGSFVGPNSCNYSGPGPTASCNVVITSATAGTTVVSASSNIVVGGETLPRSTNGTTTPSGLVNSGPAQKVWVELNAAIAITPATDTNPVGTNHTLTITVTAFGGNLAAGTATASIVSGPGSFVGPNSCAYPGGGTTASCTVVITSNAVGTTVVSASSAITVTNVISQTFTRTTNGVAPNSGPASKNWVDAKIEITPATDTNPVNTEHTLTITVTAAGGTLANGTATASITSGPGSFVGPNSCNYSGPGPTASCNVVITSATAGTTVVSASSNIVVGGETLPRSTNGTTTPSGLVNSGPAQKVWVELNAAIAITPATDTNPVGTNHTLTITVTAFGGNLAAGTATASIVSGPGSFVGPNSCAYPGGGTTASCTVVITSNAVGTTVVSASSAITVTNVISQTFTRTTNGVAPNSGPASKNWVDAKIEITPATDTNPVNTEHTLTITVTAAGGTLANGTATATIVSGPGSFVGPNSCNYSGPGPTASCTVVITSATAGTTVVSASSNIVVGGETLPRSTNGTTTPSGLVNSGPAQKVWINPDAKIEITPATDVNPINTEHTLTITVTVVNGTIAAGGGTATASITSGPGSFVGPNSCAYPGGGTTASCTVVITSATAGTTVVSATSNIPVDTGAGVVSLTRMTDGSVTSTGLQNSNPAEKIWQGGEGCTPGYWRQPQHFDSYPAGVTPDTKFSTVFGRTITVRGSTGRAPNITDPTLLQALVANGGDMNALARHAAAAYLNSKALTGYAFTTAQVVAMVQFAIDNPNDPTAGIEATHQKLAAANEQGCPLN